jgi:hypothetical protein
VALTKSLDDVLTGSQQGGYDENCAQDMIEEYRLDAGSDWFQAKMKPRTVEK